MKFHSGAVDDDKLEVAGMKGDEGISRPYRFVLDLASKDKEIDLAKLVEEKAYLSIKQGIAESGNDARAATTVKIHGVVSDVEQLGKQNDWIYYRAVLAPRLWKLTLSHNTRIFQEMTVPDLVKKICDDYEVKIDLGKLSGSYKTREYIVQYEESDFDFVQRWLEHEGIFYYFTQDDEEEVMVLGDAAEAYGTLVGDTDFDFNPQMGGNEDGKGGGSLSNDWLKKEVVSTLGCTHKQLPKEVVLNDYNWRTPADKLDVTAKVSDKGIGTTCPSI
jgi:type VI secretion system secreted protein VgrG